MTSREFFSSLPTLRTPRLILRRLSLDDAADLFAYAADPAMTRFTSWAAHRTIDESRAFLAFCESRYLRGEPACYGVVHADTGRLIGTCGLANWSDEHQHGELAYGLARTHWNQGYTTEASRAVIDAAFRMLPMHRLQASCDTQNLASSRVMEKLGMTYEGTLRQFYRYQGRFCDERFYSLLRDEWESQSAASRII